MARRAEGIKRKRFRALVWDYYRKYGRHRLPWRPPLLKLRRDGSLDPYRILVSEIMLQQTQVSHVIPKYRAFIKRFPNFRSLARAPLRDVLTAWSGLGYNRRALYLKRIAERVVKEFHGRLPSDPVTLQTFPGIGANTAGSVAAFVFNEPTPFIETNIRRAYIHHFFPTRKGVSDTEILKIAETTIPRGRVREWYYALMDYGASLGERLPKQANPNRRSKHYTKQPKFTGSDRELRGRVLRIVLAQGRITSAAIRSTTRDTRVTRILRRLVAEGMVARRAGKYVVA